MAGRGSTAASPALLLQEPDLELAALTNRYGTRASRRIWQMSRDSVHGLVMLLRRLKAACDLERRHGCCSSDGNVRCLQTMRSLTGRDQILEIREEVDMMVLMQQIGALPAPA